MTREEAIEYLKEMKDECNDTFHKVRYVTKEEALDKAIQALQAQTDGDLVSRQAVMDCFKKWQPYMATRLHEFERELSDLPSVKPQEPKTGHWIIYKDCEGKTRQCTCDQCGYKTGKYTWHNPNFCPHCGADMRGEQDG